MSEGSNTTSAAAPAATTPATGTTQEAPKAYEAPATQADLDRIVEARLARERAKFGDYDDLKAKAAKFDEAENAAKTELQRAQDAVAAEKKRADAAELRVLRAEVAAEKGVPAALLAGSTKADLEAAADALLAFKGTTPKAPPAEGDGVDVRNGAEDKSAADTVKAALGR